MSKNKAKRRVGKSPSIEKAAARQSKPTSKPEMAVDLAAEGQQSQTVVHQFKRPEAGPMTPALAAKHDSIVAGAMDLARVEEQCLPTEEQLLTSEEGVLKIPESKETTSVTLHSEPPQVEKMTAPEPSLGQDQIPASTIDPQAAITTSSPESAEPKQENNQEIRDAVIDALPPISELELTELQECDNFGCDKPDRPCPECKPAEDVLGNIKITLQGEDSPEFRKLKDDIEKKIEQFQVTPTEKKPAETCCDGRGCPQCVADFDPRFDGRSPAEEDQALTRIKRYFGDGHYVHGTAAGQVTAICANPSVMSPTTQWSQNFLDTLPKMLTGILMQAGYLDNIWPQLQLVMGTSVGNVQWASQIASSIAFFDLLKVLSHPGVCVEGTDPPA